MLGWHGSVQAILQGRPHHSKLGIIYEHQPPGSAMVLPDGSQLAVLRPALRDLPRAVGCALVF